MRSMDLDFFPDAGASGAGRAGAKSFHARVSRVGYAHRSRLAPVGTEHRIEPLRTTWSAGLPGMSLAIYEPATGTITELILEEDAHTQERALFGRIPIEPGRLYIADRNFCVRSLLFRITATEAFFLVRWHRSTLPFRRRAGCTGGGGAAPARSSSRRSRSPMTMGSPTPCDGSC